VKALCWQGKTSVTVERVNDPSILNPRDAIVRITRTAICGSDLHLYDGYIPTMEPGDVLGHEFMGEVIETGPEVKKVKKGDRVVVPFTIACGQCFFCKNQMWSACDNTNPNAWMMEKMYGHSGSALYGYSHMMGGYAGGKHSTRACRLRISDACRSLRRLRMRRSCFSPISFQPGTWPRKIVI